MVRLLLILNPRGQPMSDPFANLLSDDLSATIAAPATAARQAPASYQPQDFTEPCSKCRGRGSFISYSGRNLGPCFACKGAGKLSFKTSPEARAKSRVHSQARKVAKVETKAQEAQAYLAANADIAAWLDSAGDFAFAVAMREALAKWGNLTDKQADACRRCIEGLAKAKAAKAERDASAPAADTAGVDRLKQAFDAAIAYAASKGRGLKMPRITIGGIVISPAKATSANPGALYVKTGGLYLGKIAGGRFLASRDCSSEAQAKVLAFVADPKAAAEAYGIETGTCCICNAQLTNKESIERGIGPICATKFGW